MHCCLHDPMELKNLDIDIKMNRLLRLTELRGSNNFTSLSRDQRLAGLRLDIIKDFLFELGKKPQMHLV